MRGLEVSPCFQRDVVRCCVPFMLRGTSTEQGATRLNQTSWVEIVAILIGPLVGIWVTRLVDRAKEGSARRFSVFETLMRTRGLELSPEHVGAINMVPVVFKGSKHRDVQQAWGRLMDSLNSPEWDADDMKLREGAIKRSFNCRMSLLQVAASAVGERMPENEEHRPGYVPKGWWSQYAGQLENQKLLQEVLSGQRSINMAAHVVDYTQNSAPQIADSGRKSRLGDKGEK